VEIGHAIGTLGAPAGGGLFESAADEVFAGALNLAAADAAAFRETLAVVQMELVRLSSFVI